MADKAESRTMRAAVLTGQGGLQVQQVAVPLDRPEGFLKALVMP